MTYTDQHTDFPELTRDTRLIWDENARWWDAKMGEGNPWHLSLIATASERLLAIQSGERVLDLACGNGQFARRLARLGAQVTACDFSSVFLDCARLRTTEYAERIDYRLIDLTDEEQLTGLGAGQFDAAVCNMALMDISCITPMLRAVHRALKPSGRFVFSVPHPCFNTNGTTLLAERDDYEPNRPILQRTDQKIPELDPTKGDWNRGPAPTSLLFPPFTEPAFVGLLCGRFRS
jgi:SAM-dependent methyltransferase